MKKRQNAVLRPSEWLLDALRRYADELRRSQRVDLAVRLGIRTRRSSSAGSATKTYAMREREPVLGPPELRRVLPITPQFCACKQLRGFVLTLHPVGCNIVESPPHCPPSNEREAEASSAEGAQSRFRSGVGRAAKRCH